jgi:hypothetical protein
MMMATPVQMPVAGVPDKRMLERAAGRGVAGMGDVADDPYAAYYGDGGVSTPDYSGYAFVQPTFELPAGDYAKGTYTVGDKKVQFAGGNASDLAKVLSPVVPGVINLLTNMYSPPAYRTVTGPGGSTTEIRYPAAAAGMTPTNQPPSLLLGGMNTTTMLILAAVAAVALMSMGRR